MTDAADRLYEPVLVLRCQAGDEAALAELIERYQARLRYYVRKMLKDSHRTEDVLQEVWLNVFRAIPRLAEPAAFRVWLYRIARGRTLRELRRRRIVLPIPADFELIDSAGATERDSAILENAERVHRALDDLAPEHRDVIVLQYLEGMTYDEIAEVTGCPIGTVRSRLHYADARCAPSSKGSTRMNEKEPRAELLNVDAAAPVGTLDAKQLAAKIVQRDRRRIRWLTALTAVLWTITVASILLMAFFYQLWLAPRLKAYAEGVHDFQADVTSWVLIGDWAARIVMVYVVGQLLAAVSTIALILTTRSATIRQMNANLIEISEQLKHLRRGE